MVQKRVRLIRKKIPQKPSNMYITKPPSLSISEGGLAGEMLEQAVPIVLHVFIQLRILALDIIAQGLACVGRSIAITLIIVIIAAALRAIRGRALAARTLGVI